MLYIVYSSANIIRMRWSDNVTHMREIINANKILIEKPEGRGRFGNLGVDVLVS
jgi:hypothetical protein